MFLEILTSIEALHSLKLKEKRERYNHDDENYLCSLKFALGNVVNC